MAINYTEVSTSPGQDNKAEVIGVGKCQILTSAFDQKLKLQGIALRFVVDHTRKAFQFRHMVSECLPT